MIALLAMASLSGCATTNDRIAIAATQKAQSGRVGEALSVAGSVDISLPAWPADCAKHETTGVAPSDRIDVALLKADGAVSRGNARVDRCTKFYTDLQSNRKGIKP